MEKIEELQITDESLKEITRFLQESFPKNKKFTESFVKWQYSLNPLGKMQGFNAWHEGRIVSHFAALPIEMSLFGKIRKGLLCINVSTNENYRGKKYFTQLGQKTIELATQKGYDFMIAVPNANSSHAFLKYFGFYLIAPLSVKLGLGSNIYSSNEAQCFKTWDEAQWNWRLANPANKYTYNKGGVLSSPISFFAKTISQANLPAQISDTLSNNNPLRLLNLYIGLGADTKKSLFFNFPSFIKRPPFNLVFKDLKGDIPTIQKEDIFLQLIDLDTI